jgi:hypothetical protein
MGELLCDLVADGASEVLEVFFASCGGDLGCRFGDGEGGRKQKEEQQQGSRGPRHVCV